jgi:hypothetical protein
VNLAGAHVGGYLKLTDSKVTGKLDMNGLQVGSFLFMGAEFAEVSLGYAHVGGLFDLGSSKVTGKLNMIDLQVVGDLFMDKAEFAEVHLDNGHVGGELRLTGSKVTGKLNVNALQVGRSLFMDKGEFVDVDFVNSHVGRQLQLTGSKVTGTFDCHGLEVDQKVFMDEAAFDGQMNCRGVKIKGDLDFSESKFKQNVNLSGAEIDGELYLARPSQDVKLNLRDASINIIPGLADPSWPPLSDVAGFTYRKVVDLRNFEDWFRKLDHYTPEPYDKLASVVRSQGDGTLATAILYSGRERERSESKGEYWVWLTILSWMIGYGYYLHRAIWWVLCLVVVGAAVMRRSGEGPRNGMPFGLAFSFDILLPIIRLRDRHYQIDLQSWARYYFYVHKIMGYILASFLIAGLTGLTK